MIPRHLARAANRHVKGLVLLFGLLCATPGSAGEVTVFAAASLKTALDDIAARFEGATGHSVILSHAGSSALARQIEHGAPADIFISANPDWMDYLQARHLIATETRGDLLSNRLVLIAPTAIAEPVDLTRDPDLAGRLGDGHLAMALVKAVPAGLYGKAALRQLGVWNQVAANIAQTDNVRAALTLVSLGEAPLGIVYATDAMAEPNVTTVATFPEDSHPPILYPAAAIAGRADPTTMQFLVFLRGPAARALFENHGFAVIGS
jgi:molybdate transport system substrate-binding protein